MILNLFFFILGYKTFDKALLWDFKDAKTVRVNWKRGIIKKIN